MKSLKVIAFTAMLGLGTLSTYAHQTTKNSSHPATKGTHTTVSGTHVATKSTNKPVVKKTESKHVESTKPTRSK